jgi:hypothetical protein
LWKIGKEAVRLAFLFDSYELLARWLPTLSHRRSSALAGAFTVGRVNDAPTVAVWRFQDGLAARSARTGSPASASGGWQWLKAWVLIAFRDRLDIVLVEQPDSRRLLSDHQRRSFPRCHTTFTYELLGESMLKVVKQIIANTV